MASYKKYSIFYFLIFYTCWLCIFIKDQLKKEIICIYIQMCVSIYLGYSHTHVDTRFKKQISHPITWMWLKIYLNCDLSSHTHPHVHESNFCDVKNFHNFLLMSWTNYFFHHHHNQLCCSSRQKVGKFYFVYKPQSDEFFLG